jgi:cellulose synthase/poly-beta-1,6-N-acetylglucosamine synthase-like glycosyltransferase
MLTELFLLAFLITLVIYLVWVAVFLAGTFFLPEGRNRDRSFISVIIPARNEEESIRACVTSVLRQDYPAQWMEIVVVDDRSTDRTPEIVQAMAQQDARIKLVAVQDTTPVVSSKKRAITCGVRAARGERVFLIDADSQAAPGWITAMECCFEDRVGLVAGPALVDPALEQKLVHKLQSLEMTVLMAADAGHIGLGWPVVASGSNLAYRKHVFTEVDGFAGLDHLASGDDDLLVQKVRTATSWQIAFCADPAARVTTRPAPTWRAFFRQRIRWASKGAHYPDKLLSVVLWNACLCYLMSLAAWVLVCADWQRFGWLLLPLAGKFLLELVLLVRACIMFDKQHLIKYFLHLGVPHMPYVLAVSALGAMKKITWKG